MIKLTVASNLDSLAFALNNSKKQYEKAVSNAINKTADKAKTRMVKEITGAFNLTASDVRPLVKVSASVNSGNAQLFAVARRKGKRSLNLIRFAEKKVTLAESKRRSKAGTLRSVFVKVKRAGSFKPLNRGFILNVKGSPVMQRFGPGRKDFKPAQTIDIQQMFNTRVINSAVIKLIIAEFPVILERSFKYYGNR